MWYLWNVRTNVYTNQCISPRRACSGDARNDYVRNLANMLIYPTNSENKQRLDNLSLIHMSLARCSHQFHNRTSVLFIWYKDHWTHACLVNTSRILSHFKTTYMYVVKKNVICKWDTFTPESINSWPILNFVLLNPTNINLFSCANALSLFLNC